MAQAKKPQEILIKTVVEESKDSLKLIYRRRKDGSGYCVGFETKVYGDTPSLIDFKTKEIIRKAWDRFNEPYPKN